MAPALKMYTAAELATHNRPEDLWIAVDGKVYDITSYTETHPGGVAILRASAGANVTAAFHDVGHSDDAIEKMQTFLVGELEQTEETRVRPVFQSKTIVSTVARARQPGLHLYLAVSVAVLKQVAWLGCIVVAAKILWPDMANVSALAAAFNAVSSFWKGIILSSTVSGVGLWVVGGEIGKSLDMKGGLRGYPPVMRPTQAVRGPVYKASRRVEALDPVRFQPLVLAARTRVTPNTYRFVLQVQDVQTRALSRIPVGQHVQLRADIDNAPVVRSYTPTNADVLAGSMELTIKIYDGGKMGNHLLNLPIGGLIDVRGPNGRFKNYHRFLCKRMAMMAGGTGITPMYQIIRAICEDPADETRITLLYGVQTEADLLLQDEIGALAARFPNTLKVHIFVNEPDPAWTGERGMMTKDKLGQLLPAASATSKYLLCGPPRMMEALSRSLVDLGCDSPKAFKDATDQVFLF